MNCVRGMHDIFIDVAKLDIWVGDMNVSFRGVR